MDVVNTTNNIYQKQEIHGVIDNVPIKIFLLITSHNFFIFAVIDVQRDLVYP
jgi:hypothetical protein